MKNDRERETLSVIEAGRILGLGKDKAYEAVRCGEIPSLTFGKKTVVPRKALERMLEGGSNATAA